MHMLQSLF